MVKPDAEIPGYKRAIATAEVVFLAIVLAAGKSHAQDYRRIR